MELTGIGPGSAWLFMMEFFAWRRIRNRRELASLAGLAGTPYNSGALAIAFDKRSRSSVVLCLVELEKSVLRRYRSQAKAEPLRRNENE